MQKPNNYDNTTAPGEFVPIELGGHILTIMDYRETDEHGNKLMTKGYGTSRPKSQVIVYFDTASNDRQPNYFAKLFRNDIRPNKKWPYNGMTYITVEDDEGNCSRQFKGFVTSLEKSNPGFVFPWSDNESVTANGIKRKLIGGVFGVEKDWYDAKDKEVSRAKLRWFRSTEGALEADIPDPVETENYKSHQGAVPIQRSVGETAFMNIPDSVSDEELPFN